MQTISRPRLFFAAYLVFVGSVVSYFAFHHLHTLSPFCIGDYLINYSAGFVRRGIVGEILLLTARATHIGIGGLPWLVFLLQLVVFNSFLYLVFLLTRGIRWSYALTALLLSPATLAFGLLNPAEGMRKEILLYLTLAFFCLPLVTRFRAWQTALLLSIAAPFLVLSHELTTTCMPYLFTAAALQMGGFKRSWKLLLIPAATTLAAIIAVVLHPGNWEVASGVCSSIGHTLHGYYSGDEGVCSGAIIWLTLTPIRARQITLSMMSGFSYTLDYGLFLIPSFTPALIVLYRLWKRESTRSSARVIAVAAILSSIGSSALFLSAFDWGRWISIHITCFMLVLLYLSRQEAGEPVPAPPRQPLRGLAIALVAIYATLWALPPVAPPLRNTRGYPGLYLYYIHIHLHRP